MKLQSTFMVVLLIVMLFVIAGGIIADFNLYYGENVSTQWTETYSENISDINKTFGDLSGQMEQIANTGSKWFIFQAIIAIPSVIINTIIAVIKTPFYLIKMVSQVVVDLKIPSPVINTVLPIAITMLVGSVIFMLVKFWQRSPGS